MLRNLSEKLVAKFSSTTFGYSVIGTSCLNDAFSGILELEASPIEGQPSQQKNKKRRKHKGKKITKTRK